MLLLIVFQEKCHWKTIRKTYENHSAKLTISCKDTNTLNRLNPQSVCSNFIKKRLRFQSDNKLSCLLTEECREVFQ